MSLTRIFPAPPLAVDANETDAPLTLAELYRPPRSPWLRVNLVTGVGGGAIGDDGTSRGLSKGADRRILGAIRRLADVVLVGAATVRAEGRLLPRKVPLAVVTASGELDGHAFPADLEPGRLIVLCPASAIPAVRSSLAGRNADVVALPDRRGRLAVADIVGELHSRGYLGIVCEGGPQLAGRLLAAGLVDEICLSISPLVNGGVLPAFGRARFNAQPLTLNQLLVDETGTVYSRWFTSGLPATR